MERLDGKTLDITRNNIDQIKLLFPDALTENKIDFDKLKLLLGEEVETTSERYEFTWHGKGTAIKLAQTPSTGTLRPAKELSRNWDTTENLYLEGDNLEVLKLLQKSYFGKVKMIYIDPPYNTGNDFVYRDDFRDNLKNYKELTEQTAKANTEASGRFHTEWLNLIYPRLKLARNLLSDSGVIFISIDDNEYANLKKVCDEVFGETSFVTSLHVEMSATQGMKVKAAQNGNIVKNSEYILVYSKDGRKNIAQNILYDYREKYDTHYSKIINDQGEIDNLTSYMFTYNEGLKDEIEYLNKQLNKRLNLQEMYEYSIKFREFVDQKKDKIFRFDKVTGFTSSDAPLNQLTEVERNGKKYTLYNKNNKIEQLLFLSDSFGPCDDFNESYGLRKIRGDWWKDFYKDMGNVSKEGDMKFDNGKKPVRLIKQLIKMTCDPNDIIVDFFSGSATTAHAVMQINAEDNGKRKFILVQLPEKIDEKNEAYKEGFQTICEIGQERIRRAGDRLVQDTNQVDLDIGFKVFKLDTSNLKTWDPNTDELENAIQDLYFNIKEDRSQEDLLYEILLKVGLAPTSPIEEIKVGKKVIYRVSYGALLLCLEDEIDLDLVGELLKYKSEHMDTKVVFKENGFVSDPVKTNALQTLMKNGISDVRSV